MSKRRVVLAEYFTMEDHTLLFLVREDFPEPIVKEIPISSDQIREFVVRNFSEERNETGEVTCSTSEKVSRLSNEDFQKHLQPLITPLAALTTNGDPVTKPGDILWFVPHDFLHYLPLHAVELEGKPLIERNPVCYTPSATVMKYCQQKRKGRRKRVLILSDTEVHTKAQSYGIHTLFPDGASELYIESASKELLKKRLTQAKTDIDILHISCHGKFNAEQGRQSRLLLKKDEFLTAEEIFALELNVDLVTLGACETGINENKPGDELIGLTRALIYAGTPSVIVSLWAVDVIATNILLNCFYEKLLIGTSKVEALQQAQLTLRNMTSENVIEYYFVPTMQKFQDPIDQMELQIDLARFYFNTNNFEQAMQICQQLSKIGLCQGNRTKLEHIIYLCERGMEKTLDEGMLKRNPFIDPYFWAPFVLIGDWR
jgi:CHAT domain-containing protein